MKVGGQSEVGRLRHVLLKHARDAFIDDAAAPARAAGLGWSSPPDVEGAVRESDALAAVLASFEVEVHWLPASDDTGLDSIYVHDPVVVADGVVVQCRMGKAARRSEPERLVEHLQELGAPLLGAIEPPGMLEGGDVVWLGGGRLAIGCGYRTNDEGIRQLCDLLGERLDEVVVVPLPHWRGPRGVMHLMSLVSPVDEALLLVYSPLLPVGFRQWLLETGWGLIEVPDEELASLGCNVLAVGPGECVMLAGNPVTRQRLEAAGVRVVEVQGDEICHKGEGGPTCLTLSLLRD